MKRSLLIKCFPFIIIVFLSSLIISIKELKISSQNIYPNSNSDLENKTSNRIHLMYVHQLDTNVEELIGNFKFFLNFAYSPCDQRIDYYFTFIVNSEEMNVYEYIKNLLDDNELYNKLTTCGNTFFRIRINTPGPDICSYTELLRSNEFNEIKAGYSFFFFINSSVRGPFLPNYWTEPWWKIFINRLNQNKKLVATGPYLSTEYGPHIQSFFITLDLRGLEILEKIWRCPLKTEFIGHWVLINEVELGKRIYYSEFEIEGLLLVQNQRSLFDDLILTIPPCNPFYEYPLPAHLKHEVQPKFIENCECSNTYFQDDYFSVNVFETTWVKFHSKHRIPKYLKENVPFLTEILYENKKQLKLRSKIEK